MATGLNQRTDALLRRLVRRDAASGVRKLLARTRPEDVSAAMEMLTWAEQRRLIGLIEDRDYAATVLAHLNDEGARQFFQNADETLVVDLLDRMEPDDATDIVEILPDQLRDRVLTKLESGDGDENVRELLEWPSDTAGGIMSPLAFKMPQVATCGEAIQSLQQQHEQLETVHYVYCVDNEERLVGVTSLRSLLTHAPDTPLVALMSREVINVGPRTDQEEVARFVARYDLLAVPVVDEKRRILGIVTVDDVLDVIEDEAAEDMMLMAGMREGPAQGPVSQALRRAGWLMATTVGGILMAEIIGIYKATLETVAVLAGFIPVIMGMGGNVGIQSATVAVRGLATGHIQLGGAVNFVFKEAQVGVLLGVLFALMLGGYGAARFGFEIGGAVAISVALSIAAASAIGGAIPVLLGRAGADPAIATGPFVTTAVDILAILIYFNIARSMLGL